MTFKRDPAPYFLRIEEVSPPSEITSAAIGHFQVRAAPDDATLNVVAGGLTRQEALERVIEEIDRACFKLGEARRLAIELLREEGEDS